MKETHERRPPVRALVPVPKPAALATAEAVELAFRCDRERVGMPRGALLDLHPHRKTTGLWDECILDDASPEAELAVCRNRRVRVRVTKRAVRVTSERSSNEEWAKEAREANRA